MLLIVPFVNGEMPWDNNASNTFPLAIQAGTGINENYTFKFSVNGTNLTLLSDCSNLFVVFQNNVEVDRVYEGDCTTAQKDELNITWKMRAGTSLLPGGVTLDYSFWTDNTTNFYPSDDPALIYPFYDNFNDGSINTSKWVVGNAQESGGRLWCGWQWNNPFYSVFTVEGNWTMDVGIEFPNLNIGGNSAEIALCQSSKVGQGGSQCYGGGLEMAYGGYFNVRPKDWFINSNDESALILFEDSVNGFPNATIKNATFNSVQFKTAGNSTMWLQDYSFSGTSYWINDSKDHDDPMQITCGQSDISFPLAGTNISLDYIQLHTYATNPPTLLLASEAKIIYQLKPLEEEVVNGINLNVSCSSFIADGVNANVTNFTMLIYNTTNNLDKTFFHNVSYLEQKSIVVSNVTNLTGDDGTWKWSCSYGDTDNVYTSSTNRTFYLDTGVPSISLFQPFLEGNLTNMLLSYSILDDTDTSCYWSIGTSANQSQSCGLHNATTNTTTIDVGALGYTWGSNQFLFYANDSSGNSNTIQREIVIVERISQQGTPTALNTQTSLFNLTIDDTLNVVSSASLNYNGTIYPSSLGATSGTQERWDVTIPISKVGNLIYNWTITGIVNGTSDSHTYSQGTQTVGNINLFPLNATGDCVANNAQLTLNFTFRDEASNGLVTGVNTTASYNVWTTSPSNSLNFSWKETQVGNSSYIACLDPDFAQVSSTFKVIYGGYDNTTREFNLQNQPLNNITQNYTLYLVKSASTEVITFNIVDSNGIALKEYLVKIYLKDFGNVTDSLKLVYSAVTDFNGQVVAELDSSQYYQVEIWKDGTLVYTVQPFVIQNPDGLVTIVVPLQDIFSAKTITDMINGITSTITYSNATGNVTATWNDPNGLATNFCLRTDNLTSGSINAFSYACDSSSSGSLVQQIGNYSGINFYATLRALSAEDENYYSIDSLSIYIDITEGVFGLEGVYWSVVAIGTIVMLAIPSVTGVVLTGIVGMAVMGVMLGFVNLTMAIVISVILVGGLIIVLVKD